MRSWVVCDLTLVFKDEECFVSRGYIINKKCNTLCTIIKKHTCWCFPEKACSACCNYIVIMSTFLRWGCGVHNCHYASQKNPQCQACRCKPYVVIVSHCDNTEPFDIATIFCEGKKENRTQNEWRSGMLSVKEHLV